MPGAPAWRNAVCGGCGCACDDLELRLGDGRLVPAANACPLGMAWFASQQAERPAALVRGAEASLTAAVTAAAEVLAGAASPLVYGLGGAGVEAQRRAVALAEALGATIDGAGAALDGGVGTAAPEAGWATATLGELRARADLLVCWRADPLSSHPRHLSRYSLEPAGLQTPNGRRDRTLLVVDSRRTATAERADMVVKVRPGWDFEVLWALRGLLKEAPVDPALEGRAGLRRGALAGLLARLGSARMVAFLYDSGLAGGGHLQTRALLALVIELNRRTRAVALPLRREANAAGLEDVLAWQTGYPSAVNLARGRPRSNPAEFGAAGLLARGEVDAALVVASDPLSHLPAPARRGLRRIPTVVLGAQPTATSQAADVVIHTAALGVEAAGTVHRMDGVPQPVRAPLPGPRPTDAEALDAIAGAVGERR